MNSRQMLKFNGPIKKLKQMRILVLEDGKCADEAKLSQIINQLKQTDAEMLFSSFSDSLEKLRKSNYNFMAIVVIASYPTIATKRIVTRIMKALQDNEMKQIPFAIVSGNLNASYKIDLMVQNEFEDITRGSQLTFPLSSESLITLLLKLRMRARFVLCSLTF